MEKITEEKMKKLSSPEKRGRKPRNEKLYTELEEMKVGEKKFMSVEEWAKTGYKVKSLNSWFNMIRNQKKKGHVSRLNKYNFKIHTFKEGWVVEKLE